jgi:hypothetical protein
LTGVFDLLPAAVSLFLVSIADEILTLARTRNATAIAQRLRMGACIRLIVAAGPVPCSLVMRRSRSPNGGPVSLGRVYRRVRPQAESRRVDRRADVLSWGGPPDCCFMYCCATAIRTATSTPNPVRMCRIEQICVPALVGWTSP